MSLLYFNRFYPCIRCYLRCRKYLLQKHNQLKQTMFVMMYSIFYLNGYRSIKNIFDKFIDPFFDWGLSGLYYTINESKLFIEDWPANLLKLIITFGCVDARYPIFIAIDDSLVEKRGDSFEYHEKLFDHTTKNAANYLSGHFCHWFLARQRTMYACLWCTGCGSRMVTPN